MPYQDPQIPLVSALSRNPTDGPWLMADG